MAQSLSYLSLMTDPKVISPALDEMLRRFLSEQEADRAKGFTLEALHTAQAHSASWQAEHEAKDDKRHDEIMGLVQGLGATTKHHSDRIGKLEKTADDSGQFRTKLDSFSDDLDQTEGMIRSLRADHEQKLVEMRSEFAKDLAAKELERVKAEALQAKAELDRERTEKRAVYGKILWTVVGVVVACAGWGVQYLVTHPLAH